MYNSLRTNNNNFIKWECLQASKQIHPEGKNSNVELCIDERRVRINGPFHADDIYSTVFCGEEKGLRKLNDCDTSSLKFMNGYVNEDKRYGLLLSNVVENYNNIMGDYVNEEINEISYNQLIPLLITKINELEERIEQTETCLKN